MPRDFDSDDARTREAGTALMFTENVECPRCGAVISGAFFDAAGSDSVEDIVDPPVGHHYCICGHNFISELSGWTFYSEAG